MKNLIVNIYKTLFFFDFALIVISLIPNIKTKNPALLKLWQEGIFLIVLLVFTAIFYYFVERKKLKIFNFKKAFTNYSLGLITAIIPISFTVLVMWVFKFLSFNGINKISNIIYWLLAILINSIANELLLRGYLFKLYRKFYNLPIVIGIITFLFISLNIDIFSKGIIYSANMLIMNILLCLLIEYTNSIITPIITRFIYNCLSCFILGSMSSIGEYPALLKTVFSGNKLFSGGNLKIEGSILILIALIALCVYLLFELKKQNKIKFSLKFLKKKTA